MGRPKGSKTKVIPKVNETKICSSCKETRSITQYYKSTSQFDSDGYLSVCKICINNNVNVEDIQSVKDMLLQLNKPFLHSVWISTCEEAIRRGGMAPFGLYLKNLYINFKELTWKDSDFSIKNENFSHQIEKVESVDAIPTNDEKNKQDVLRMLGYDPFEFESVTDKRHLFNKLVDFLDESTLEDSFKLPAVIEIVKSFNQLDKINSALAVITQDATSITQSVGSIKSLIDAKEKMLKNVLALAKDNGISVNYNNNKSKGAGTLSGIIKQLNEKGISSSDINIYDIETCEGMRQVADISNKSIIDQLMLNENDYTEMIKDQREMIINFENKLKQLEEENRLLKIKLRQYETIEN